MGGRSPILVAALTGFVSGLFLSIPIGPINLTILNEGARRGFKWASMIGMGAVAMEVLYCFLAFTGFASFFSQGHVKAAMELSSFIFMLYLGLKFIFAKSVAARAPMMPGHPQFEQRFKERIEGKFHPSSAFMTGFVRVMANPGVLVFWIILAANFISRQWVDPEVRGCRMACIAGVAAGTSLWFLALSWGVSLGQNRFSEHTLLKMERGSGVFLLALAVAHAIHIILEMARHQI